jgi:hypothetical protein
MNFLDFYAGGESNYMVYLETKKRYHSIFTKSFKESKLFISVSKTLSEKILVFEKILRNVGYITELIS